MKYWSSSSLTVERESCLVNTMQKHNSARSDNSLFSEATYSSWLCWVTIFILMDDSLDSLHLRGRKQLALHHWVIIPVLALLHVCACCLSAQFSWQMCLQFPTAQDHVQPWSLHLLSNGYGLENASFQFSNKQYKMTCPACFLTEALS